MNSQEHQRYLIRIKNEAFSVIRTDRLRQLVSDFIDRYHRWYEKLEEYQQAALTNPKLRKSKSNNQSELPQPGYEIEKENLLTLEDGTRAAFWRPPLPPNPLELIMPTDIFDRIYQSYDYWSTVKNTYRNGKEDEKEILAADAFLIAVICHKLTNGIMNIELPEDPTDEVWGYYSDLGDLHEYQRGDKTRSQIRNALEHIKAECSKESLLEKHDEKTRVDHLLNQIKNHPLISVLIILGIVIIGVATVLSSIETIAGFARKLRPKDNFVQQIAVHPNQAHDNNSTIQENAISKGDPNDLVSKYGDSQKALGKTEYELEKIKRENQELLNIVNAYKLEDKEKRAALERAENTEKTKILVKIFQEQDKGNISKEESSKLSDMVNKTPWEDLKSFIGNKNIEIDEHNQSLVASGIFMAEVEDSRGRRDSGTIIYVLTPGGNKLYEIAKTINLE